MLVIYQNQLGSTSSNDHRGRDRLFRALLEAIKILKTKNLQFNGPHVQWNPLYIMDVQRHISKHFAAANLREDICSEIKTTLEKRLDINCPPKSD